MFFYNIIMLFISGMKLYVYLFCLCLNKLFHSHSYSHRHISTVRDEANDKYEPILSQFQLF